MKTSDFNYDLPERLIAQTPVEPRDSSRMMVCNRNNSLRQDRIFHDIIDFLRPGDVMVINETRVIPARLLGVKESTGVPTEFLLLKRREMDTWEALVKPGRRLHAGDTVSFGDGILRAEILDTTDAGGRVVPVLLHVGLGTFRPVKEEDVEKHVMHSEYYEVSAEGAEKINAARKAGGRLLCIGTTSMRTIETVADENGVIHPGGGMTNIFIKPGVKIKAVDMLLTNFHLPQSTLLMLVSTLMGRENALDAYQEAVRKEYRFFSFGDCMLIGDDLVK